MWSQQYFYLANEKGKFVENFLALLMSGKQSCTCTCRLRPEALSRSHTYCVLVYLVREIIFSGKCFEKWCLHATIQILYVCAPLADHYSVIFFVGKVPLGTSMRDAEKLYSECADQVNIHHLLSYWILFTTTDYPNEHFVELISVKLHINISW